MIEKWTAQDSMAGIGNGHARPQVPTGGVGGINQINPKTNTEDLARHWAIGPANLKDEFGRLSELLCDMGLEVFVMLLEEQNTYRKASNTSSKRINGRVFHIDIETELLLP